MATGKDVESFHNPKGDWSLGGPFSIELTEEPDLARLPASTEVNGKVVTVKIGSAKQSIGGIEFYSEGQLFRFNYSIIKAIRDGEGSLIWVNKYL